jgi:hypothetical protein
MTHFINKFISFALPSKIGLYYIKRGQRESHRRCMVTAFGLSMLFFVLYVMRYALTGPTRHKNRPHHLPHLTLRLRDGAHHLWDVTLCPLILVSRHITPRSASKKTPKQCGFSPRDQIIAPPLA